MNNNNSLPKSGITITRIYNAPKDIIWDMFTNPEQIKKWFGPKDFTTPFYNVDFKVGGKSLCCMRSADGHEFWSTGTFKEIVPLERIVTTDSFADKDGNIISGSTIGMGDDWPDVLEVIYTFENFEENKTKFTLQHIGIPEGEIQTQCMDGWNQSFDKLDELLK